MLTEANQGVRVNGDVGGQAYLSDYRDWPATQDPNLPPENPQRYFALAANTGALVTPTAELASVL